MPDFTTHEAADMLGVTPRRVRQLAQELGLGRKFGRDLALSEADIESLKTRRPVGRPKREP